MPAAADALGSGPAQLRRATITLAITQLISWGVLYYPFAVVAPPMTRQPGWGVTAVSGAFSVGLLASGLCAHAVAALIGRLGPRAVMTAGSLLTIAATALWASAASVTMLYAAWTLIGVAMAATLYEPAIVVLALMDSRRMRRTIATVTAAGGLASTVFVPLTQHLVDVLNWRAAVAVLGCGGGALTAALHARYLPRRLAVRPSSPAVRQPALNHSRPMGRVRIAYLLEQASAVAVSALLVMMLIDRGVDPRIAGWVLAASGAGKVAGRLILAGRTGRMSPEQLAAAAAASHAIAVVSMLAWTSTPGLCLAGIASGAAAGTSSVLRPLIVAQHVPRSAFAAANARLQASATFARAGAPLIVAAAAAHAGWSGGWALVAGGLTTAAVIFAALARPTRRLPGATE